MTDMRHFADELFAKGKTIGFADMEINLVSGAQFSVGVFKGEIDSYAVSEDSGLSFRGLINGKMGYAFTEKIDESSIEMLLGNAKDNAQLITSDEVEEIFAGSQHYEPFDSYSDGLDAMEPAAKIALAKEIEQAAYAKDPRVFNVQATFSDGKGKSSIINSKGLSLSQQGNNAGAVCQVVVRDGSDTKTAYYVKTGQDYQNFSAAEIADKAVTEACSMFGASSVPSKTYRVLLRYDVAATLLAVFSGAFSAENVQKGMSLLKGKVGTQIAQDNVTIIDDPFLPGRPNSGSFDAEGVATHRKKVVENGKLATYLYNLKSARKDGVSSTGNAAKSSYKAAIGTAPVNLYIQPGQQNWADLVQALGDGLIIIDVQGTHSGAHPVSGDFSLSAYGYLVEYGKVVRPVNQITIAGNFFEMLQDVVAIGNDLDWGGIYGAPSLLIRQLAVAGK